MKKAFSILFLFFLFAGIFAQTNTEYQTQLSKAKEYEKNKQYINALFCYYEAINAEPTLKAEEAFDGYTKLLNEIKNGNPGYGEFDEFTIYDGWKALCIEYEQFWTKNCPYVFGLYLVDDSKTLDMEKRTASYSFGKTRLETYFFTHITEAMEEGLKKTRTKSWKGIPNDWPFTSIYHEEKNSFLKNGVALFRVNSETYFAPSFFSETNSNYDYVERYGYTLFEIDFDFIDKNGKKIFSIPKVIYEKDGRKSGTVQVENLSQNVMKIIDAGEYDVKVTSIRLHYGNFISEEGFWEAYYNTTTNHEKIKRLPQISYDVEKLDKTYSTALSFVEKAKNRKLSLILVEGGKFPMGSKNFDGTTVSSFYIWRTEVTQAQWKDVMGNNPSYCKGDNRPVDTVNWYDAIVFCNKMSLMDDRIPVYSVNGNTDPDTWEYQGTSKTKNRTTGYDIDCQYQGNPINGTITMNMNANGYRLPTEAEWEYAARGGKKSKGYKYSGSDNRGSVACYYLGKNNKGDTIYSTQDVATKAPNELGLYDMSGNVREWCWDWYDPNCTGDAAFNGKRVLRGGSIGEDLHEVDYCAVSERTCSDPRNGLVTKGYYGDLGIKEIYGFRVVCRSNEMIEQARLEEERIEKERLEQERLEKERIEKERLEQERLEQERLEKERIELEKKREKTIRDLSSSFVYVEGGQFKMGSLNVGEDEKPVHKVTLSSFDMAKTEVTQEQWTAIMEDNPSSYNGNMRPVNNVSWYDAIVFCNKLSILDDKIPVYSVNGQTNPENWNYTPCHGNSLTGTIVMNINANGYRLPTEAEWEYAARGGKKTKGYKYSGSNKLKDVAWYSDNNGSQIHDVATKSPNELGLYDMSGNVWEWCWDWYGSYSNNAQTNPVGPSSGNYRVVRGGSWGDDSGSCRVARRGNYNLYRYYSIGFRLVRSAK